MSFQGVLGLIPLSVGIGILVLATRTYWPFRVPYGAAYDVRRDLTVLFRAHGDKAFGKAADLLSMVAHQLKERDGAHHALLMDAREARQAHVSRLQQVLNDTSVFQSSEDLQRQFGEFFDAYQWCSRWIYFTARNTSYPLTLPAMKQWRDADEEFLRELKRTIVLDRMRSLNEVVNSIGWGEEVRAKLAIGGESAPKRRVEVA